MKMENILSHKDVLNINHMQYSVSAIKQNYFIKKLDFMTFLFLTNPFNLSFMSQNVASLLDFKLVNVFI